MTVRFLTLAMSPASRFTIDHRRCAGGRCHDGADGWCSWQQRRSVERVLCRAVLCRDLHWNAVVGLDTGIDCKTERFYDLTGGLTYVAIVEFSLWAGSRSDARVCEN